MRKTHRAPLSVLSLRLGCCFALLAACSDSSMMEPSDGGLGQDAATPIQCAVVAPTACPEPAPRYADVQPIFEQRCVSCHSGRGEQWPLTTYQHAADWYGPIHDEVLTCAMPPPSAGIPITDAERVAILTWLRCGFPL